MFDITSHRGSIKEKSGTNLALKSIIYKVVWLSSQTELKNCNPEHDPTH